MSNPSAATSTNAVAPTRSHYVLLDGLRGVAALMVVLFHLCEAYANNNRFTQKINHGYLAVDFFFLLSGFVIAHAYDDRWPRMSTWGFFQRRLIRLQPMVIMGSLIGAALFYFGKGPTFAPIASTPVSTLLLVMLIGCTLIPIPVSMDIRGWQEMHPLDGPAWSLFFEYLANILYAVWLRKVSIRVLSVLTFLAALFLLHLTLLGPRGDVVGGWSITAEQLHIGFARLLFPFLAGMLLQRLGKRVRVNHAFALCSLLLVTALALPRFGGPQHLWANGLYEALCIMVLFPLLIAIGAGDTGNAETQPPSLRIARFFGDLSYPLYITHYPLVYVYTAWVIDRKIPAAQGFVWGAAAFIAAILIAYACLKLYDEPVRRWLSARFLSASPR